MYSITLIISLSSVSLAVFYTYCITSLKRFLTCVSHTAHVIDIGWTSVCPSVCLSVRHTLVLCRNGSTYIVKLSSLPGSPMILVF